MAYRWIFSVREKKCHSSSSAVLSCHHILRLNTDRSCSVNEANRGCMSSMSLCKFQRRNKVTTLSLISDVTIIFIISISTLHFLPLQIYHSSVLLAILYLPCHHGLFFAFTSLISPHLLTSYIDLFILYY